MTFTKLEDFMKFTKYATSAGIALAFLLATGVSSDTFAQGRGNGGGRPSGNQGGGRPANTGRPTTGPGVDRGIDRSSDRSNGRSDDGRNTASERSNGRYDNGIERARMMRENRMREADREIERNPRVGEKLRMNANDLRSGYQTALITNPDLKFGQYVAANMIAPNLGSTNPNITANAILSRLAQGDSIGAALRSLGVGRDEAKRAEKAAKRQMND
jgi:hypothetical protein